jgi:uncharacterized membrane protein
VIEDANLVVAPWKYLLITPLIFFFVFAVTMICLFFSRNVQGENFYRSYAVLGLVWTLINLSILTTVGFGNMWVLIVVFLLGSTLTAIILSVRQAVPWLNFLDYKFNTMIIYAHMLDSSSTYIGVDWFGYYEKHVVPNFLINLTDSALIMFPLKLIIILPVLSMIDRSIEDPSLRNLAKLTLIILGLAPAVRNSLRLALGV